MRRGFTLVQISILLTVASLVMVAILPSGRNALNANNATTGKMAGILTAMRQYETVNAALPCPADATQPTSSATYGIAAGNAGGSGNCYGGTPSANYSDSADNVAIGMVPVRTLGLAKDYAVDAFGRTITYAVDTTATSCFSGSLAGKITVTDNGLPNTTIAALVSHGLDGHGAWIPLTGTTGSAVRLNAQSSDSDQLTNAHVNGSFTPTTVLTNFVRKAATATFDDLVVYKSPLWTLNTQPAGPAALFPTMPAPASGSYYTGQTIDFIVTFPQAVTVSTSGGTPRIAITLTSGTVYASYYSGTGSSTLDFRYTVASGDYAPLGMTSTTSPIDPNGGTLTEAGAPACLTYTPPNVNGILINPLLLAVPFYYQTTANSYLYTYAQSGSAFAKNNRVSMNIAITTTGNTNAALGQGNPDGGQVSVFSPDNTYLAFADSSSGGPFLQMYKVNSTTGIYSLMSSPFSTAPSSDIEDARWSYGGNYFAVAAASGNGLMLYQRSGDTFTLQSSPTEAGHAGMSLAFTHDTNSTWLVFAYNTTNSPLDVYKNTSGSFPASPTATVTTSAGTIADMRFSPDDSLFAVASAGASRPINLYSFNSTTGAFTLLATPSAGDEPGSAASAVAWSPDGTLLAAGVTGSPQIVIYTHTGSGPGASFAKSAALSPGNTVNGLAWSSDGKYLAATLSDGSTPLILYSYAAGAFTKLANVATMPQGYGWRLDFTHQGVSDN